MDLPVLAGLEEPERRALVAISRRCTYERDQVVCRAGDVADSMHLICSGRLSVWTSLPSGATAMIHVFGPGDFFGENALLRPGSVRGGTVRALEPVETLAVPEGPYRALAARRWPVHRYVSALMASRVDALSRRLFETLYLSLDERLRARLRELVGVYGGPPGPVTIPLNQTQMADLVGGTRPSVNQALRRLEEDGLVVLSRGRVEVPDPALL